MIGLRQNVRQFGLLARRIELPLFHERVEIQHPHAQRRGGCRHAPGDVPEADQAAGGSGNAIHRFAGRHRPAAAAYLAVVEGDLPCRAQQHCQCVLGHLLDAVSGVVGDDDAGVGCRIQIDSVHTDAVAGDDLAPAHPRHDIGGDRPAIGVEQGVAVRGFGKEGFGIGHLKWDQIAQSVEDFTLDAQGFPHIVGQNDFCLYLHIGTSLRFNHYSSLGV